KPEPVSIEAGQRMIVRVKVRRENCSGAVAVKIAEASPEVVVLGGLVGSESEEGSLEVEVASDATIGKRTLRLRAVAADAKTEGELELTIRMAGKLTNS